MRTVLRMMLVLSLAAPAAADQVFLNNGDRISGSVQFDSDAVTVASALFGAVKVPRSAVARIVLEKPQALLVRNNVVKAREISFKANDASIGLDDGKTISTPAAGIRVAPANSAVPGSTLAAWLRPWNAAVDAGFTAARGNTALDNLHFGFNAVETAETHRFNLAFSSLLIQNLATGSAVTTVNTIRSGIRYEYNVADRTYGFGILAFDSDQLQHLDLRSVLGGGIGFRIADTPAATIDVFSGGTFDQESFSDHANRNSGELLAGAELAYRLSSRTSLSHRFAMFPNMSTPGDFRANFDSSAVLKLNRWLGWQWNVTEMYLTNPVGASRKNDLLVTTGIRFMLGQERTFKPRSKVSPLSSK